MDPENKPNLVKLQLSNVSPKTIYDNVFKVWIKNVKSLSFAYFFSQFFLKGHFLECGGMAEMTDGREAEEADTERRHMSSVSRVQ